LICSETPPDIYLGLRKIQPHVIINVAAPNAKYPQF